MNNETTKQARQFIFEENRLYKELFDSVAVVYIYDSLRNSWYSEKRTVKVEKEYSRYEGHWTVRFIKEPGHNYATFTYRNGKLVVENYPDHVMKIYNSAGELSFLQVYNWKLKQVESSNFINGIISKNITRDKDRRWNSNGRIDFKPQNPKGDDTQAEFYVAGKLVKKEIVKNHIKTVTEYDAFGKVKAKYSFAVSKYQPGDIIEKPAQDK